MNRALTLLVLSPVVVSAGAAEYATKAVRIITPFPPGGSVDL
jgi:tripartite-type tricarboxylate transporter receptor subunit TctC